MRMEHVHLVRRVQMIVNVQVNDGMGETYSVMWVEVVDFHSVLGGAAHKIYIAAVAGRYSEGHT